MYRHLHYHYREYAKKWVRRGGGLDILCVVDVYKRGTGITASFVILYIYYKEILWLSNCSAIYSTSLGEREWMNMYEYSSWVYICSILQYLHERDQYLSLEAIFFFRPNASLSPVISYCPVIVIVLLFPSHNRPSLTLDTNPSYQCL